MSRSLAFLMRSSNGALSHDQIMRLTWKQYELYLDAFTFWINQESEKGRQQNELWDAMALSADPDFQSERQQIIEKTKRLKKHGQMKPKGTGEKLF